MYRKSMWQTWRALTEVVIKGIFKVKQPESFFGGKSRFFKYKDRI